MEIPIYNLGECTPWAFPKILSTAKQKSDSFFDRASETRKLTRLDLTLFALGNLRYGTPTMSVSPCQTVFQILHLFSETELCLTALVPSNLYSVCCHPAKQFFRS